MLVKKIINKILRMMASCGVDLRVPFNGIKGILTYYAKDYINLQKQINKSNNKIKITKLFPIHSDRFEQSGVASGHYFHQDFLVARKIFKNNPIRHLDIGSRFDGFVTHVATFREIEVLDIRPLANKVPNVIFKQADLMKENIELHEKFDSVSSLHAVEHFGLGRYGDTIDINGSERGLENIYKLIKSGGKFYFSVPIGKQRIEFNAHRVFSVNYLCELFKDKYKIDSFSYVNDKGDLIENVIMNEKDIKENFDCRWGCGIFELTKLQKGA